MLKLILALLFPALATAQTCEPELMEPWRHPRYAPGSGLEWDYLFSEAAKHRYQLAAALLRDVPNIVEIGGYKVPITAYLQSKHDSVLVVDPKVDEYEAPGIHHVRSMFQDYDFGDLRGKDYGLVLLGLSLKFKKEKDEASLRAAKDKLLELINGARVTVIEYASDLENAQEIIGEVFRRTNTKLRSKIEMDFTGSPGMTEFTKRTLLVLDRDSGDHPLSRKHYMIGLYDGLLKGFSLFFGDPELDETRRSLHQKVFDPATSAYAAFSRYDVELNRLAERHNSRFASAVHARLSATGDSALEIAVNHRQMVSKLWLAEEARRAFGRDLGSHVLVMGGWYGILPALFHHKGFNFGRITSYDLDPESTRTAQSLNAVLRTAGRFEAITDDVLRLDYRNIGADLVINTSSEHMERFDEWYASLPAGTRVILQSNDYFAEPTHVNCVRSLDEFRAQAPMSRLLYAGSLKTDRYTRFMLIGVK